MTTAARPDRRALARLWNGGRSTLMFVVGSVFEICCVINVPGAAIQSGGDDPTVNATTFGVLLALLAIACWVTVFFRTRAPIVVIVAGGLLMAIGLSYVLALIGVFHALIRWPQKTSMIASVTTGAVALYVVREAFGPWGGALAWILGNEPDGPAWNIGAAVFAVVSLGLVAGLVALHRARTDASASRARAEKELHRADALDQQVARQAERERIARDLHDGLGHRLSSVALAAGAFEAQAAAATVDPALAEWARITRSQAHAALDDVRGVVGALRSETGADTELSPASMRMIGQLLADVRRAGHRIDAYVIVQGAERLSPAVDAAAYRITQESITNAIKHAPGAPTSVTVDATPDSGVRIRVVNAIVTSSAGIPGGGRGLTGIRERVSFAGGTSWIGPHEGQFIVDVSLPWEERA